MSIAMDAVKFKCPKCGAEDTQRCEIDEGHWPAMNCWKCADGRGTTSHQEMIQKGVGMRPASREPEPAYTGERTFASEVVQ